MTIADLQVPPLHQAAPTLHASFSAPERPHLATASWRVRGRRVTAGILAASHQVLVDGRAAETVACDVTDGVALEHGTRLGNAELELRARVEHLDGGGLAALVERHLTDARTGTDVLVGRFPTHPLAVTVVRATATGWASLHTYPGTDGGIAVHTETEVRA